MSGEPRFRINADNVVHEAVDGEVIAIDLASGSYYSLSGGGPAIWGLLEGGASDAEVRESLRARFDLDDEAEPLVEEFLDELRRNSLVVAGEGGAPPAAAPRGTDREPFEPPILERYTDMKDFFLLDPIHEVDPQEGWPKPAAG